MKKMVIFGGTTEGRQLAEYCIRQCVPAIVCVASDYGTQVLPEDPYLEIKKGRMDEKAMESFLKCVCPGLVFDATHPYAKAVSENAKEACARLDIEYIRVLRPRTGIIPDAVVSDADRKQDAAVPELYYAADTAGAVRLLEAGQGTVLLTTGSKELPDFCALSHFTDRIYARVLPDSGVLAQCERLGIRGKHIIAMQGPFSVEMNMALLRQLKVSWLVTKESGAAGGFAEKLLAAAECGVKILVIGRPGDENGIPVEAACQRIRKEYCQNEPEVKRSDAQNRHLYLVGIGAGSTDMMTCLARKRIQESDAVLGARRMLEAAAGLINGDTRQAEIYKSEDILKWWREHTECRRVCVCYSGDTGFYSGATQLLAQIRRMDFDGTVEVVPGISSVSYLFSRIGKPWHGVFLTSAHGKDCEIGQILKEHSRVFLLLGDKSGWRALCDAMIAAGFEDALVTAGENLSYPDECIHTGTPLSMREMAISGLAAVYIETGGMLTTDRTGAKNYEG